MKKTIVLFISSLLALCLAGACPAPCTAAGEESILVVSDTHLTGEAQAHADMAEAVIRAAHGMDAVLLLGDNTNNTRAGEHAVVLQWAQDIERETGAKVFIIPGNHDYSVNMGAAEFRAQYSAYGWDRAFSRDDATASCAVLTEGGTCLLLLDTNQFDGARSVRSDGGIAAGTLKWLREVLKTLPDGTPVIACGHHPILPPERNGRTPGSAALSQVLQDYGVGLYLCGHDHGFATVRQDHLRQITVGQPQAYPGWAGVVQKGPGGFVWHTQLIYDPRSPVYVNLLENARSLGRRMAQGTLAATPYADDSGAIEWFATAFMAYADSEMTPEGNAALLADENCRKWREAETPTVVKKWILGLLENCPEDIRHIAIPHR